MCMSWGWGGDLQAQEPATKTHLGTFTKYRYRQLMETEPVHSKNPN